MPDHSDEDSRLRDNEERQPVDGRVGIRIVRSVNYQRRERIQRFDPAGHRCSRLAAQLADEWLEYADAAAITYGPAAAYRRAIDSFCATVDAELASEGAERLVDLSSPRLARIQVRWERSLPATFSPGSRWPAYLVGCLRLLIIRHDDRPDRDVATELARIARGPMLIGSGETSERDEFSRKDKLALVRAAWTAANELDERLSTGWQLAAQGQHPDQGSWLHVPDLLWGLSRRVIGPKDIRAHLPRKVATWPTELLHRAEREDGTILPKIAKLRLLRSLVAQLYPTSLDLHAFRILLMDATGMTSEEVTSLGERDIEFLPKGVRLTAIKKRAGRVRHRAFRDNSRPTAEGDPVAHTVTDRPRREVSAIIARLLKATEKVREQISDDDRLFVRAAVMPDLALVFDLWKPDVPNTIFSVWMKSRGLQISGAPHIGRLRKSTKVEKAIIAQGRVSIAADDHTEQTFAGHYAQGTTLRIISGEVITAAQHHWFRKAVEGPTVITADAEQAATDPGQLEKLGLDTEQADGIVQGQLDMGLSHCKDPYDSPFSPAGDLCSVAPLRCLECQNAWVLPSHLPQLLLFAEHLEKVKRRMPPARFTTLWGQSYTNLRAILSNRSEEELALARQHVDTGQASLNLPLAAHTEFDQ